MQHYVFHHVPVLWRLHRMHHADLDIDVTTGVRFHPIEILISIVIKIAIVLVFGIPAIAVLIFEIALNATSMFNHANVAMPSWLDRIVRLVRRHARHASRASFDHRGGDQQQFRIQSAVVGLVVSELIAPSRKRDIPE